MRKYSRSHFICVCEFVLYKFLIFNFVILIIPFFSSKIKLEFLCNFEIDDTFSRFYLKITEEEKGNCPLCNITSDISTGDSTSRDIALCFSFQRFQSLIPFLRTFNSVSNATVVILADNTAIKSVDQQKLDLIAKCRAVIIPLNYDVFYVRKINRSIIYNYKIKAYKEFLEKYHHYIDRVMFFDLEDTVFQSDPFRNDYYDSWNNITMFKETYYNRESKDTELLNLSNWNIVKNLYVVNGATGIGPAKLVFNFLNYTNYILNVRKLCELDQSVFNAISYTWGFQNLSLKFGYITTANGRNNFTLDQKVGYIRTNVKNEMNPLVGLHHTHFDKTLLKKYYESCPPGNFSRKEYIHGLTYKKMKKYDNEIANSKKS